VSDVLGHRFNRRLIDLKSYSFGKIAFDVLEESVCCGSGHVFELNVSEISPHFVLNPILLLHECRPKYSSPIDVTKRFPTVTTNTDIY
jgi:hypothetical protein